MAYTTIDDPSAHFHIQLYSGTGSSQSITNDANAGDFKPDWILAKNRSDSAGHIAFDSSRGVNKNLTVNSTDGEATVTTQVTAFNTDGFTMGSNNGANGNGDSLVAWQWKANGGTTTTNDASSTGVGTIDSVYQANTTAGFSIVTYTGAASGSTGFTIAHGLGAVPKLIIVKNRDSTYPWEVFHGFERGDGARHYGLSLDDTHVQNNSDTYWNDTNPTSTVFSVRESDTTNRNGDKFVAYCFSEIQGYSKFGGYEANGNDNGPFIYTGFKPAWILFKNIDNANNWVLHDNKRGAFNVNDEQLSPNNANAEATDSAKWIF